MERDNRGDFQATNGTSGAKNKHENGRMIMRPLNVRSNYTTPKVHIWAVLFLFFFSLLLFYFILFFHFSKSNRYRGHALQSFTVYFAYFVPFCV